MRLFSRKLKLEPIATSAYEIYIAPNSGGCWAIRDKHTDMTTNLFVGTEGMIVYRDLKAAWRKSHELFDNMCAEYSYG